MKIIGTPGQKIKKRSSSRRKNPKRTRVARCVRDLKRDIKAKRKKPVRSVYGVCSKATRQSYATGRRTNPLPFKVSFKGGPAIAEFRSLPRAAQYARALANRAGRTVQVSR